MLKGLMDHWVPTAENISAFWKSDFETVKQDLSALFEDIALNNFTFYSKWYTNGIKSRLPYLRNHPECMNVVTDNDWGRRLIDYLHSENKTAGVMLQMLTYEKSLWDEELSVGEWDCRSVAESADACLIADFSSDVYIERAKALLREQLTAFPGLDHVFLEFEGFSPQMMESIYSKRAARCIKTDRGAVDYDDETLNYCARLGLEPNLLFSGEAREMLKSMFSRIFMEIDGMLAEMNFKGTVGVVYMLYGYEAFIYPHTLPNNDWWLLPWWYWTFERADLPDALIASRKNESKKWLKKWKDENYKICYIGDVALGDRQREAIKDFYDYCVQIDIDGHLGMGNPELKRGLRWAGVTDETVIEARELYKQMY